MSLLHILQTNAVCNIVFDYLGFSDAYKMIYYVSKTIYHDLKTALWPFPINSILNRSLTNALNLFMGKYGLKTSNILDDISNLKGIIVGEFPLAVFIGEFPDNSYFIPCMDLSLQNNDDQLDMVDLVSILRKANYIPVVNNRGNPRFANLYEMYHKSQKTMITFRSHTCFNNIDLSDHFMKTIYFTCLKCLIQKDKFGKIRFRCDNLSDVFNKVVQMNDNVDYRFNHFIHNPNFEKKIVPKLYKHITMGQTIHESFFKLAPKCYKQLKRYKKPVNTSNSNNISKYLNVQ
jgi:hypothetical protein